MKKIGLISIYGNYNFGNKLQIYAIQKILIKLGYYPEIIKKYAAYHFEKDSFVKTNIKSLECLLKDKIKYFLRLRSYYFIKFDKNHLNYCKKYITGKNAYKFNDIYDVFIAGSDQIWNCNWYGVDIVNFLKFADNNKKIAFAASFGINKIRSEFEQEVAIELLKFKYISVREEQGKNIIENLTKRKDVHVLLDPTMLLEKEEWSKLTKRPKKMINSNYILCYFLGEINDNWWKEIVNISEKYNYKIINIMDKKGMYYKIGPDEFLYLEKNASLICTDSFHASIFGIIFDTPFIVFDRQDKNESMRSRLDSLLNKFGLEDRMFDGAIIDKQLERNFKTEEILLCEREKSLQFLKNALK